MKQYKLIIDGQPSWTSFYIQAPNDRSAAEKASAIVASYGKHVTFTLTRGGGLVALAQRAAERLSTVIPAPTPSLRRTA